MTGHSDERAPFLRGRRSMYTIEYSSGRVDRFYSDADAFVCMEQYAGYEFDKYESGVWYYRKGSSTAKLYREDV